MRSRLSSGGTRRSKSGVRSGEVMNASEERGTPTVGPTRAGNKSWRLALALLAGPTAWLVATLVGRYAPGLAETVYGGGAGAFGGYVLARATAWLPFSLAEFALMGFVGLELARLGRSLRSTPRWKRLGAASWRVARDLSLVVAVFYVVWGFHYARPTLPERAAWPDFDLDLETRIALAGAEVDRANTLYRALHGREDAGVPTALDDVRALDAALEASWANLPSSLELPAAARWSRGPVKELLISPLLHRLGLSGFYFPFTGEANVNAGVPIVSRARVMSHEKAHQRGIGPEDEANFLGWMAAARADHDHARYAASVFAQRQLLFTLPFAPRDSLVRRRVAGVQRDVNDLLAYWRRTQGPARDVTRQVNHAYLRSNRVHGGVESYGRSVRLLLAWAHLHDALDVAPTITDDPTTSPTPR